MFMARYELNEEHNGVEIYFDSVPDEDVRAKLRENGWRWFKAKKMHPLKKEYSLY